MATPYGAQAIGYSDSVAQETVGAVMYGDLGKEYLYVLLDLGAHSALASRDVLTWLDRDAYEVTADVSAGQGEFAGVLPLKTDGTAGSFTDGEYAWVQIAGDAELSKDAGDDSYADGTGVIVDASSDAKAAKASAEPPAVADVAAWIGRSTQASDDTNDIVYVRLGGR